MPCPPILTAIIRWHIGEFGLGPSGRLFVGERNKEELPTLTINRIWRQARQEAFTPEVHASPLAETRTTCAMHSSRRTSTPGSRRLRWRSGPGSHPR